MIERASQVQIDTRALEKSQRAETLIEQHLEECYRANERAATDRAETRQEVRDGFQSIRASIGTVHGRIDKLVGRWFAAAGTLILLLLGICGFLFVKAMEWN